MDSGEIVLGIGQLSSSIILGLMAVKYSKKVVKIELERKEVEERKERVELLDIINILKFDLLQFSYSLKEYPYNRKTNKNLSFETFLKIIEDFKIIKVENEDFPDEEVIQMALYKNSLHEDYKDMNDITEKSNEILIKERELFKRCVFLIDILEIRDDISDSQSILSKIRGELNNPDFHYSESPLLFSVKKHIHLMTIVEDLDRVRSSIKKA